MGASKSFRAGMKFHPRACMGESSSNSSTTDAIPVTMCSSLANRWNERAAVTEESFRVCARPRNGLLRELNPGPLAPEARIMPLDQAANNTYRIIGCFQLCEIHLFYFVAWALVLFYSFVYVFICFHDLLILLFWKNELCHVLLMLPMLCVTTMQHLCCRSAAFLFCCHVAFLLLLFCCSAAECFSAGFP